MHVPRPLSFDILFGEASTNGRSSERRMMDDLPFVHGLTRCGGGPQSTPELNLHTQFRDQELASDSLASVLPQDLR
jgi:hypothetical protein